MMSTVNRELYDALLSVKVPEEKAAAASIVDTDVPARLKRLETKIEGVDDRLKLVERMSYAIIIGVVALILKAYLMP